MIEVHKSCLRLKKDAKNVHKIVDKQNLVAVFKLGSFNKFPPNKHLNSLSLSTACVYFAKVFFFSRQKSVFPLVPSLQGRHRCNSFEVLRILLCLKKVNLFKTAVVWGRISI